MRKVGETVYGTVTSLATAFEFPISVLKVRNVLCLAKSVRGKDNYDVFSQDSARPEYWVPDAEITSCSVCDRFSSLISPFLVFLVPPYLSLSSQTDWKHNTGWTASTKSPPLPSGFAT